jgi:hypothetical protein
MYEGASNRSVCGSWKHILLTVYSEVLNLSLLYELTSSVSSRNEAGTLVLTNTGALVRALLGVLSHQIATMYFSYAF